LESTIEATTKTISESKV
jgi:chromosome segregation ATPase